MGAMKILAFDTAMAACSVALVDGDGDGYSLLAGHEEARPRGHAEVLVPLIGQVMEEARTSFADLDRIAVTTGPGTFTGVRIGIATARGLALASGVPLVGITTLEAIAADAMELGTEKRPVACVIDARRGEVYVQCFAADMEPLSAPAAMSYEAAAAGLADHGPVLVGTGAHLLTPFLAPDRGILRDDRAADQPRAAVVAQRAALREPAAEPPVPLYLRAPDAKLPK